MPQENRLPAFKLINKVLLSWVFGLIFFIQARVAGLSQSLVNKLSSTLLMPIIAALESMSALLAVAEFATTHNKNLGSLFNLLYRATVAALVIVAVFFPVGGAVVPLLLIGVISSGVLYHAGLALYNLSHWFKTQLWLKTSLTCSSDTPLPHFLTDLYRKNIKDSLYNLLFHCIVLAGALTCVIYAPLLPATLVAATAISTTLALVLMSFHSIYNYFIGPEAQATCSYPVATGEANRTASFQSMPSSLRYALEPEPTSYFYRKFREEHVVEGNKRNAKQYLTRELEIKLKQLADEQAASKHSFLEVIWPQANKRQTKRFILQSHMDYIHREDTVTPSNEPFKLHTILSGKQSQSFFRQVSDTDDLDRACMKYYEIYGRPSAS